MHGSHLELQSSFLNLPTASRNQPVNEQRQVSIAAFSFFFNILVNLKIKLAYLRLRLRDQEFDVQYYQPVTQKWRAFGNTRIWQNVYDAKYAC